ncbi:MAG TPA: chemotaxis protein CheA [Steroidobacteraceae bacterium]|nr:chemotaxis protein CheA [Steroidobacteraceae bacterium]
MTLDLAQFHETFFEEGFEALGSMETALLKLSAGEPDAELINTIFRVAHSIKGGSATFGFADVAAFTHTLETLLDQLRSGQRHVHSNIVDVLLRSVDVLREMLSSTQRKQPVASAFTAGLHAQLQAIVKSSADGGASAPPVAAAIAVAAGSPAAAGEPAVPGWHIRLIPGPLMMEHGNDPLRMLRELASLGTLVTRVDAGKVPTLAELDPEECVLSWQMELRSDAERAAIDQIFEWAEGECTLSIEPMSPVVSTQAAASNAAPAPAGTATAPAASAAAVTAAAAAAAPDAPVTPAVASRAAAAAKLPSAPEAVRSAASEGGSIRVSIEKIDELLNSVGELVITQSVCSQLAALLEGRQADELRNALVQFERHMRSLQESVMRVRMLPIASIFNRFPRMIRDLGQRLGKKVELKMSGDQTELDKTVLEKIGDPLVHLVRNAVDHGIEMPDQRRAAGKDEQGKISLHAYHKGGNVIVEVSDDGAGLQRDKILAKARERGLVGADEELPDDKILNLIFAPGFSTVEVLSDVSGRGVGMDVVRRNINQIGGHVQLHSTPGKGSTVRIRLPLTLAILDGQLARVGREIYIVPIVSIVETIQIKRDQINSLAGKAELFRLRDEYIPIIRLYELFGIQADNTDLLNGLLMIVEADGKRVGLFVDELLSQQQVVIKSLETNFRQVTALAGATMLGDGRVALILDIPGVIVRYMDQPCRAEPAKEAA